MAVTLTSSTNVNSLRPTLTGVASPNTRVGLFHTGGSPLYGYANVDATGRWQLTPTVDLAPDSSNNVNIALSEFNAAGQQISGWTSTTLNVSGTGTVAALPHGSGPTLTSSTTINSLRPTLTGLAAANAMVHVYHAGGSPYYGAAYTDNIGRWQLIPSTNLASDTHGRVDIAMAEFSSTGQMVSPWTSATLYASGTGGGTTMPPGSAPTLTSSTTVNSLRPTLIGLAAPNAPIHVYHSGGSPYYGLTYADSIGRWQLTPTANLLVDGSNGVDIAFAEFNTAGQQVSTWSVARLNVSGASTGGTALTPGSTPVLTSQTTVKGQRPTLIGLAAPNVIVRVFHAGGSPEYGTAYSDSIGRWQLIPATNLVMDSNNRVDIALAEFNATGNQQSQWNSLTLSVY